MNIQLVGIFASIFSAVSMAPQLIKILKDRDAENVSILTLCVLLAGLSLWIWYGVLVKDLIIIISNAFSVLLNMVLLFCAFRFK